MNTHIKADSGEYIKYIIYLEQVGQGGDHVHLNCVAVIVFYKLCGN